MTPSEVYRKRVVRLSDQPSRSALGARTVIRLPVGHPPSRRPPRRLRRPSGPPADGRTADEGEGLVMEPGASRSTTLADGVWV